LGGRAFDPYQIWFGGTGEVRAATNSEMRMKGTLMQPWLSRAALIFPLVNGWRERLSYAMSIAAFLSQYAH